MAAEQLCQRFAAHLRSNSRAPILVSGEPGCGKTWTAELLARWSRENLPDALNSNTAEEEPPPVCVIEHHVDLPGQAAWTTLDIDHGSGSSRRHTEIVRAVLRQLKHTFALEKEVPSAAQAEERTLLGSLTEWAQLASARGPTVLIIDGVDDLEDYGDALRLSWLPDPSDAVGRGLSAGDASSPVVRQQRQQQARAARPGWRHPFQIVVTARPDGLPFESVEPRGWSMWCVRSPSATAAQEIWDALLARTLRPEAGRTVEQQQQEEEEGQANGAWGAVREVLVELCEHVPMSPRFIEVLLGELQAEPEDGQRTGLCRQLIGAAAAGSVQSLYAARIRRLAADCGGDAAMFRRVLAWLWVARRGLTCTELEGLLRTQFGGSLAGGGGGGSARLERVLCVP
jgi:DNA polymerase III delta prime subunit